MRTPYKDLTEEQKERKRASSRAYHQRNREKVLAQRRLYEQSEAGKISKRNCELRYKASGKRALTEQRRSGRGVSEARKEARKRWAQSADGRIYHAVNRACRRSLSRNLNELDMFVLIEAHHLVKVRKQVLGTEWHVDHIIPITKGGTNHFTNIQVVPASWNRKKSNKHTEKFFGA